MFKNCTAFRITGDSAKLLWHKDLADVLTDHPSGEPDKTQWARLGFATPEHFGESSYVFENEKARVIYVEKHERVLPGKVIKKEVAARAAEMERRDGVKPHRKLMAQLKDLVISELLPNAFVKATGTHVLITRQFVLVESGSSKLVDEIIMLLAGVMGGLDGTLECRLLSSEYASQWLKSIALGDEPYEKGGHFKRLDAAVVEGASKSVARFRDKDLSDEHVQDIILNGRVKELAVSYHHMREDDGADLHCVLTESLVVKRIKFSDVHLKQAAEDAEGESTVTHFDATLIILASLLNSMLFRVQLESTDPEDEL